MNANKIIKSYITMNTMFSIGVGLPMSTYVILVTSNGVSIEHVPILKLVMLLTVFIMEVPTGLIGDVIGRAKSISTCFIILVIGSAIYYVSRTIYMYAVAEAVLALGITFYSGSAQAWLVDNIRKQGYANDLTSVFSKVNAYQIAGGLFGGIAGAFLAEKSLSLPWAIAACVFLGVLIFSVKVIMNEEENSSTSSDSKNTFIMKIKSIREFICVNKGYQYIVLASIILSFFAMPLNMFWQPYFNQQYLSVKMMGVINGLIQLSLLAGTHIGGRYKIDTAMKGIIGAVMLISIALVGVYISENVLLVLVLYLFHEVGRGILSPIQSSVVNRIIPADTRATLLSVISMTALIGYMLAALIFSGIVSHSIKSTWLVVAIVVILIIPLYYKALKYAGSI